MLSLFLDSFVYLCDFHREQTWDRWLNASHNGVQLYKSQILYLLRNIATASTEEGLRLAKGSKILPPYMSVDMKFTPKLMEHPSKEHIKEKVRDIQQYLRTVGLSQLSEALAKGIREVSKQLDDILQEADTKLQESEKYDERRELFKAAQELIEEYSSKLQSYKDSLARKPTVAKPKDKFKKRF